MKTKDTNNNKDIMNNKNSKSKTVNKPKPIKVRFKRTKIFFGALLTIIVLIVTINTIKTLYIGHIEIKDVKTTRAKLSEIATALSEIEPKTPWTEENSCYRANDVYFTLAKSSYGCDSLHKASYGKTREADRQKIMDKTTEVISRMDGLEHLKYGENEMGKRRSYGYSFDIERVTATCSIGYSYHDDSMLLDGGITCTSRVSKYTHDRLK